MLRVFPFDFCVMCFWDSDVPFRMLDKKKPKANLQIPGRRKNVCREIKNGNANNVVFYAILAHPFSYAMSAQKSKHKNHKHKTQNILFETQCRM